MGIIDRILESETEHDSYGPLPEPGTHAWIPTHDTLENYLNDRTIPKPESLALWIGVYVAPLTVVTRESIRVGTPPTHYLIHVGGIDPYDGSRPDGISVGRYYRISPFKGVEALIPVPARFVVFEDDSVPFMDREFVEQQMIRQLKGDDDGNPG